MLSKKSVRNWASGLLFLQVADGIFTYLGVKRQGIPIEGNPIIRSLIVALGPEVALVLVKFIACCFVVFLSYMLTEKYQDKTLFLAFKLVTLVYATAVGVWAFAFWLRPDLLWK